MRPADMDLRISRLRTAVLAHDCSGRCDVLTSLLSSDFLERYKSASLKSSASYRSSMSSRAPIHRRISSSSLHAQNMYIRNSMYAISKGNPNSDTSLVDDLDLVNRTCFKFHTFPQQICPKSNLHKYQIQKNSEAEPQTPPGKGTLHTCLLL